MIVSKDQYVVDVSTQSTNFIGVVHAFSHTDAAIRFAQTKLPFDIVKAGNYAALVCKLSDMTRIEGGEISLMLMGKRIP